VVDDQPIVCEGLRQLLEDAEDFTVCGEARSAREALGAIKELRPDIAIVDLSLGDSMGVDVVRNITSRHSGLPVIVLSIHDEDLYAERALRAGAKGYVMKTEAPDAIVDALRKILGGGMFVSDSIAARMVEGYVTGRPSTSNSALGVLTDRELEVFELTGSGLTTRQIAEALHISVKTAETHRAHIKKKLGLATTSELLQHAFHWAEAESRP
jgi:DNA-binding NarL/FixJ family response regulator